MGIVIPYSPRPLQRDVHNKLKRFNVIVCHRRWGKTVFAINELIKTALTCPHNKPRTAYLCPLHKQAKQVAWDYVKEFSRVIPGVIFNEAELRADYPNGGRLQLFGADNPDALRGIYLDGVVLDEYAQISPRAWSEVIRPALSDRKGWATFIGTPMGMNEFYKMYDFAQADDDWLAVIYKASETGIVDADELVAAKKIMTDAEYEQEFECSWSAAIRGAYYGKLMDVSETEGRVTNVPYDPAMKVITSWDLGINDATVVWFWQVAPTEIRAIECMAFQSTGLPDIIKEIATKPYDYIQHIAPHDIAVRELGSGLSRLDIARDLGVDFDVAPKQSITEGINAVRMLIPKMYFDKTKCATGIEALKLYRTEYDDKKQVFRSNPLHDWTSDYTDSVRYFAVTTKSTSADSYGDWSKQINE